MSTLEQLLLESTEQVEQKPHFRETQTGPWENYQQLPLPAIVNTPLNSRDKNISPKRFNPNSLKAINFSLLSPEKKSIVSSRKLKSDRVIQNWQPSEIPSTFKLQPSYKKMQINFLKQSLNVVGKKARSLGRNQFNQIEEYRSKISKTIREKKNSIFTKVSVPSLYQSREKLYDTSDIKQNSPIIKDRSCQTTFSQLPTLVSNTEKHPTMKGLKKQKYTVVQFQQMMIQATSKNSRTSKTIATQNDLILKLVSKLPIIFTEKERAKKITHLISL